MVTGAQALNPHLLRTENDQAQQRWNRENGPDLGCLMSFFCLQDEGLYRSQTSLCSELTGDAYFHFSLHQQPQFYYTAV